MSDNPFDYSEHQAKPTHEALTQLTDKVDILIDLQAQKARLEDQLKVVTDKEKQVSEFDIPELMEEINLKDFKTKSGMEVDVKEATRANITDENKAAAYQWLRDTNNDSIIKNEVIYSFGRGEDTVAAELIKFVTNFERPLTAQKKESVHAQTLSAFVRNKEAAGEDVPDCISVFHQKKAVVKAAG